MQPISVFLASPAGMEPLLLDEAREIGLPGPKQIPGGVECQGGWEAVRRANLRSRIASRVLARIAKFDARGFPALIAGLRAVPWTDYIAPDSILRLEASVSKSRASHGGAVTRHLGEAVRRAGMRLADGPYGLRVYARLDNDVCTVSLDTSGNPLHMRGAKRDVNAAPLRETLASGFLRAAGFTGQMPVFDPMCGSGTFVIEAAMIASGQRPGFARSFAFTGLPSHDAERWRSMRAEEAATETDLRFTGRDRSGPTIGHARWNAGRAKIGDVCDFAQGELADATPPDGPSGLVITNPPYGHRLGGPKVAGLYAAFGKVMTERFKGWKIALVTSEDRLAQACNLRWEAPGPYIDHGGIKIRLWQAQL